MRGWRGCGPLPLWSPTGGDQSNGSVAVAAGGGVAVLVVVGRVAGVWGQAGFQFFYFSFFSVF